MPNNRGKKSLKVVKSGLSKEMRKAPSEKFITSAKYKLTMEGKEKLKIKFKRPESALGNATTAWSKER